MSSLELVRRVDAEVRDTLTYRRDEPRGGYPDNWSLPEGQAEGDCEDWMMLAAQVLRDAGVSPAEMYFSLMHTDEGPGFNHAVLLVHTEESGLVTCGDTWAADVYPVSEVYPEAMRRKWARLDNPTDWRLW